MKFAQYQLLKEHALAACQAEGGAALNNIDAKQMNPIVLAYIGDVVFSMYVRVRLLPTSGHVRVLNDLAETPKVIVKADKNVKSSTQLAAKG